MLERITEYWKELDMWKSYDTNVLIAGAGPAGLVLGVDRGRSGRTLVAADRAPDAIYKAANGGQRRVFEDLRGPQFTLLLFDGVEIDIPADVRDLKVVRLSTEGEPAATYGVSGPTTVLIRPDNYIGLFDESPDRGSVANYFANKICA